VKRELPGNLDALLPLRLVLSDELRFVREQGRVIAEHPARGCEYVIEKWQYELMISLSGKRTFGEILAEVTSHNSRPIPPEDWLLFYDWLYRQELIRVLPQEDVVYELAVDNSGPRGRGALRWLQRTALVAACLAILRIAYVGSPALEPAVDRLYAEVENWFESPASRPEVLAERRMAADPSSVRELSLAGSGAAAEGSPVSALREELAACRLRRDEFYPQNNEEGYRREVARLICEANR